MTESSENTLKVGHQAFENLIMVWQRANGTLF